MSFKVVIDSCGELTDEMKASGCFETASLMIQVDDHNIVDDATFDQADFLRRVAASPNCPKSSCPSPEAYRAAFDYSRKPDDVLDCERYCEVFCDHSRYVHDGDPAIRRFEYHGSYDAL